MSEDQTFEEYWKAKEKYFFRYALRNFASFRSLDSGGWEDGFSDFAQRLWRNWNNFRGEASRDTWAIQILRWTFFQKIAASREMRDRMINVDDWGIGGEDDGNDGPGIGVDFPEPEPIVDPDDAGKLITAVDSYLDKCVETFVKGKRNHMASRESVKAVFLLKITETELNGSEIQVLTGITPPQQVAVKESIKQCIETRARLDKFGEVIDEVKKI